jgi:hypothetical protein
MTTVTDEPGVADADEQSITPEGVAEQPPGTDLEVVFPGGFVAAAQRNVASFSTAELAAVKSILNFDPTTPEDWGNVQAFLAVCHEAGLNPLRQEAYLMKRESRKHGASYTRQTGIDGYRKMGRRGGYRRVVARLWTGAEDDPKWWREVEDDYGNLVRRRVWQDYWPDAVGADGEPVYPGASKVVVEYFDAQGELTTQAAVANWAMYVALDPVYANGQRTGEFKVGAFWRKGGAHMLAKCAEALAIRMAFPAETAGFYVHEEMTRADAERRVDKASGAVARVRARAHRSAPPPEEPKPEIHEAEIVDAEVVEPAAEAEVDAPKPDAQASPVVEPDAEPEPVAAAADDADVTPEAVVEVPVRDLANRELALTARFTGHKPEALARRKVLALHKNLAEFTDDELLSTVLMLRPSLAAAVSQVDPVLAAEITDVTDEPLTAGMLDFTERFAP